MPIRTMRITEEQDTILVVRHTGRELRWCPLCGAEVDVITLSSESLTENLAANKGQGWIATGKLHVSHEPNGQTRICLPSLFQCIEPRQVQAINFEKETS